MLALDIKSLTKEYAGKVALEEVSFQVSAGTVHGFLGPNGAGKSTCMNIIANLLIKTSGEVLIFGEPVGKLKNSIGYLPEKLPLYDDMRVEEYLRFVFAIFRGQDPRSLERTISRTGLDTVKGQLIGTLSRGFRQRVAIAQAIVHNPKLIILDEPTLGLDPISNLEIRSLITDLKKDHTVFLSTHLLSEAEILCDELTLIHQGKVVVSGKTELIMRKLSAARKIRIRATNWDSAKIERIEKEFSLSNSEFDHDSLLVTWKADNGEPHSLLESVMSQGIKVQEFFEQRESLETVFYQLTNSNLAKVDDKGAPLHV
jgi:ABC-2 type transport system ATP-binding protein